MRSALLLAVSLFATAATAITVPPIDVRVTNKTVPVEVVTLPKVKIGADAPGDRVVFAVSSQSIPGAPESYTVPAGKRLIVTHYSAFGSVSNGRHAAAELFNAADRDLQPRPRLAWFARMAPNVGPQAWQFFTISEQVNLIYDAGMALTPFAFLVDNSDVDPQFLWTATIYGRLVDAQ